MKITGGRRAEIVALAVVAFAGCTPFQGMDNGASAGPCESTYSAERCARLRDAAADAHQVDRGRVVAVEIVPAPTAVTNWDGTKTLVSYGGAVPITVRLRLVDGLVFDTALCGGIPTGPACTDDPHLDVVSATSTNTGYRDTPDGATPMPTIDPQAASAAQPIRIPTLHIPIDHVGAYRIILGTGSLPNGVITESRFALADDWPKGVVISGAEVRLVLESLAPGGRRFVNVYEHGWHPGVEPIRAVLEFDVESFSPGAALDVRDVVVQ